MYKTFMKLDPKWWFDQGYYFTEHSKFWFEVLRDVNVTFSLVLDLGCGRGRFTVPLARISEIVIAVDISRRMLELVRRKRSEFNNLRNVLFVVADLQYLPFRDNCADMINSIGTLVHISNPQKAINEFQRVAAIGGKVLVDNTNYLSLRFLWDKFRSSLNRIIRIKKPHSPRIFVRNCNSWEFRKLFSCTGLSIEKMEGFQVIPFLPLVGVFHDARFHLIPPRFIGALDKPVRRLPFTFFAYNILIVGKNSP